MFTFTRNEIRDLIIAFIVEFCCHLTRLSMLKRTIGFPASKFFFQVTLRIIFITLLTLVLPWLTYSFVSSNIPRFFSVCIVSVFSCITFGFYGGLENSERQLVISKVHSFINHTLHKWIYLPYMIVSDAAYAQ